MQVGAETRYSSNAGVAQSGQSGGLQNRMSWVRIPPLVLMNEKLSWVAVLAALFLLAGAAVGLAGVVVQSWYLLAYAGLLVAIGVGGVLLAWRE